MSIADWGRFAADEPLPASHVLRAAGDLLEATGHRLVSKSGSVRSARRAARLRRRGEQRLELAQAAHEHAIDLERRAAGVPCLRDPLRPPLEGF